MRIITSRVYPPIPPAGDDWIAYYDGRHEDGPFGFGRTEKEAITNLKESPSDQDPNVLSSGGNP